MDEIKIVISGPQASGKTLLLSLITYAIEAAGLTVKTGPNDLPAPKVTMGPSPAAVARRVIKQLGLAAKTEVVIETTNETWPTALVGEKFTGKGKVKAKRAGPGKRRVALFQRWALGEKLTGRDLIAAVDETLTRLETVKAEVKPPKVKGLTEAEAKAMLAKFRKDWPEAAAFFDHAKSAKPDSQKTPKELINSGWSDERVQAEMERRAHPEATADAERFARPSFNLAASMPVISGFIAQQEKIEAATQTGRLSVNAEPTTLPRKDPRPNWLQRLDLAIQNAEPNKPLIGLLGFSTYRGVQMVAEVVRTMPASLEVKLWDWRNEGGRVVLDREPGCILGRVLPANFKPLPFRFQEDRLKPILKEIYLPKKGK